MKTHKFLAIDSEHKPAETHTLAPEGHMDLEQVPREKVHRDLLPWKVPLGAVEKKTHLFAGVWEPFSILQAAADGHETAVLPFLRPA